MQKTIFVTRLDENDTKRIDELIQKKEFDSRSSFVRKACIELLKKYEQKILA